MPVQPSAFKRYDIRGRVPAELDAAGARLVGTAFARLLAERGGSPPLDRVIVGHDMRPSSPELALALADGVRQSGTDVVFAGLAATDEMYHASGLLSAPAAIVTASHNPAGFNGIKLCLEHAAPFGGDAAMGDLRRRVEALGAAGVPERPVAATGRLTRASFLDSYVARMHELAPVRGRRLRVVVDAGNGMAGRVVPAVFATLDVALIGRYLDLDGTFPNHDANPLEPANLVDLRAAVVAEEADIGLAFDGDADRCFVVDERGEPVTASAVAGLIAVQTLEQAPGSTIVVNAVTSRAVDEVVAAHGGRLVRSPVGHPLVKAAMAADDAVFGGEHSGHYYFRAFDYADSGVLAALHVLGRLAGQPLRMSELVRPFERYASSGEVNVEVDDPAAKVERLAADWARRAAAEQASVERLDGLGIVTPGWWASVRASNTEPLLRLNVEATDAATVQRVLADLRNQVGPAAR